jgi:hypothetical protein
MLVAVVGHARPIAMLARLAIAEAHVRLRAELVPDAAAPADAPNALLRDAALGEAPALDALDRVRLELDKILLLVEHVDVVPDSTSAKVRAARSSCEWV